MSRISKRTNNIFRPLLKQVLNCSLLSRPVFFNLFMFTAPCKTEKIWRHPYLAKMTIRGTLSCIKTKKGGKLNICRHPWHDTSSRHPGWEPLIYKAMRKDFISGFSSFAKDETVFFSYSNLNSKIYSGSVLAKISQNKCGRKCETQINKNDSKILEVRNHLRK